jgi:hypothetical protein
MKGAMPAENRLAHLSLLLCVFFHIYISCRLIGQVLKQHFKFRIALRLTLHGSSRWARSQMQTKELLSLSRLLSLSLSLSLSLALSISLRNKHSFSFKAHISVLLTEIHFTLILCNSKASVQEFAMHRLHKWDIVVETMSRIKLCFLYACSISSMPILSHWTSKISFQILPLHRVIVPLDTVDITIATGNETDLFFQYPKGCLHPISHLLSSLPSYANPTFGSVAGAHIDFCKRRGSILNLSLPFSMDVSRNIQTTEES